MGRRYGRPCRRRLQSWRKRDTPAASATTWTSIRKACCNGVSSVSTVSALRPGLFWQLAALDPAKDAVGEGELTSLHLILGRLHYSVLPHGFDKTGISSHVRPPSSRPAAF